MFHQITSIERTAALKTFHAHGFVEGLKIYWVTYLKAYHSEISRYENINKTIDIFISVLKYQKTNSKLNIALNMLVTSIEREVDESDRYLKSIFLKLPSNKNEKEENLLDLAKVDKEKDNSDISEKSIPMSKAHSHLLDEYQEKILQDDKQLDEEAYSTENTSDKEASNEEKAARFETDEMQEIELNKNHKEKKLAEIYKEIEKENAKKFSDNQNTCEQNIVKYKALKEVLQLIFTRFDEYNLYLLEGDRQYIIEQLVKLKKNVCEKRAVLLKLTSKLSPLSKYTIVLSGLEKKVYKIKQKERTFLAAKTKIDNIDLTDEQIRVINKATAQPDSAKNTQGGLFYQLKQAYDACPYNPLPDFYDIFGPYKDHLIKFEDQKDILHDDPHSAHSGILSNANKHHSHVKLMKKSRDKTTKSTPVPTIHFMSEKSLTEVKELQTQDDQFSALPQKKKYKRINWGKKNKTRASVAFSEMPNYSEETSIKSITGDSSKKLLPYSKNKIMVNTQVNPLLPENAYPAQVLSKKNSKPTLPLVEKNKNKLSLLLDASKETVEQNKQPVILPSQNKALYRVNTNTIFSNPASLPREKQDAQLSHFFKASTQEIFNQAEEDSSSLQNDMMNSNLLFSQFLDNHIRNSLLHKQGSYLLTMSKRSPKDYLITFKAMNKKITRRLSLKTLNKCILEKSITSNGMVYSLNNIVIPSKQEKEKTRYLKFSKKGEIIDGSEVSIRGAYAQMIDDLEMARLGMENYQSPVIFIYRIAEILDTNADFIIENLEQNTYCVCYKVYYLDENNKSNSLKFKTYLNDLQAINFRLYKYLLSKHDNIINANVTMELFKEFVEVKCALGSMHKNWNGLLPEEYLYARAATHFIFSIQTAQTQTFIENFNTYFSSSNGRTIREIYTILSKFNFSFPKKRWIIVTESGEGSTAIVHNKDESIIYPNAFNPNPEYIQYNASRLAKLIMQCGYKPNDHIHLLLYVCYGGLGENSFAAELAKCLARYGVTCTIIASETPVEQFYGNYDQTQGEEKGVCLRYKVIGGSSNIVVITGKPGPMLDESVVEKKFKQYPNGFYITAWGLGDPKEFKQILDIYCSNTLKQENNSFHNKKIKCSDKKTNNNSLFFQDKTFVNQKNYLLRKNKIQSMPDHLLPFLIIDVKYQNYINDIIDEVIKRSLDAIYASGCGEDFCDPQSDNYGGPKVSLIKNTIFNMSLINENKCMEMSSRFHDALLQCQEQLTFTLSKNRMLKL